MNYRVDELARAAGVSVDTIRFYQGRRLLERPRRQGRRAVYSESHLATLRRIRTLLDQGFSLSQIRRMQEQQAAAGPGPAPADEQGILLEALAHQERGPRTLTREALAREAGIPEVLIQAAQAAGLVHPTCEGEEERFGEADLEMARAALEVLAAGFPLDDLIGLARRHAAAVTQVADAAIDLFDEHVRKPRPDEREVTREYQRLLPEITRLVALHFQRTLVTRALERLSARGDEEQLERALAATRSGRLEVEWHS